MVAMMTSLRKMCPTFQFVNVSMYVNSKNITALHCSDFVYSYFGIKIPEIIEEILQFLCHSRFCFIIPTPPWPSKLNSDWFFCRLRQWGVWRITWQILSSFLTVFLSDWAWLISQRIQQEIYKCVFNFRVLQTKKSKGPKSQRFISFFFLHGKLTNLLPQSNFVRLNTYSYIADSKLSKH